MTPRVPTPARAATPAFASLASVAKTVRSKPMSVTATPARMEAVAMTRRMITLVHARKASMARTARSAP